MLLCMSIYLPYGVAWNTVAIPAWAGAPGHYLFMLDWLQKPVRRTLDPSLTASLELLAHRRNVASLSLSIGITLVDSALKDDISKVA